MTNYGNMLITGALLLCFMYGAAWAGEYKILNIEPGNYELTETSSSTQTPDEVVKIRESCMKDSELDPAGEMARKDGCEISNYKSKGNAISFDFLCKNAKSGSKVSGSLEFSSSGKEFTWKKVVKTELTEDQEFTMNSAGKAVRKGDCS
jgi:Protein of unknown function (DUF3617)